MKHFNVSVEIMPMKGVNDPQGDSLTAGLTLVNVSGATNVRVGKLVRFTLQAESQEQAEKLVDGACMDLLVNLVVEEYSFSVQEA